MTRNIYYIGKLKAHRAPESQPAPPRRSARERWLYRILIAMNLGLLATFFLYV